jgi:hypothetical protein
MWRVTKPLKPTDKAMFSMVSELSGRNESEHECSLEKVKYRKPRPWGTSEGSMNGRKLIDTSVHFGGV